MQLTINLNTLTTEKRLELFALLNLVETTKVSPTAEPEKKTRVKRTETPLEDTKEVEKLPEPTQEVKTPSKGLSELKALAQQMVVTHDREKVKAVINKYAEKLSEVKESDYDTLFNDLNSLGA